MTVVAAFKGEDKFDLTDKAISESKFLEDLDRRREQSGKNKENFLVAIKPNIMMFTHSEDPVASYTDPALVEHLIKKIRDVGFGNIRVVESRNSYGNWYKNREVENVARIAGYTRSGYDVVDLSLDLIEHTYSGILQTHFVGRTWEQADYRISFAKNKTHVEDAYTLTLKCIYGTTPMEDKMYEYHALREWDGAALDMLDSFPVNFGFIDAFNSADGMLGFKGTTKPKPTNMILASPSLIALDAVASKMMRLDPYESRLMRWAAKKWGMPTIERRSNVPEDYVHPDWENIVPEFKMNYAMALAWSPLYRYIQDEQPALHRHLGELLMQRMAHVFEKDYLGFSIMGILTNGISGDSMDLKQFPMKTWDELSTHIKEQTIRSLTDLVTNLQRQRRIANEIRELFRAVLGFSSRRKLSDEIMKTLQSWQ